MSIDFIYTHICFRNDKVLSCKRYFFNNRFDFVVKENNIKCKSNNYERDNGVVPFFIYCFIFFLKLVMLYGDNIF